MTVSAAPRLPPLVRLLPWAAVVLPLLILGAAAALSWRAHWQDARAELIRSADALAQYGARVLTAHVVFTGRMNDLLRGLSDDQIRAQEQRLHTVLGRMIAELPQADSSYVIDREGVALVSGNLYPVPRGMAVASDRDFFLALQDNNQPDLHVSRVYVGRYDNVPFFAVSRRREGTGNPPNADGFPSGFQGVVNVSLRPGQLSETMTNMLGGASDTAAFIRSDGQLLVRTQGSISQLPSIRLDSVFHQMAAGGGSGAVYEAPAAYDGQNLLITLRKVEGFPVYAAANRPRASIIADWQNNVATHLVFGLPSTLALLLLSLRVQRDHKTLVRTNASLEQRVAERTDDLNQLSEALDLSTTLIMRRDGTILHWSRGCERLYGYTAEEVEHRGRHMLTRYGPGEREAILATVDRHGEWRGELSQRHKDGSQMVVLSHWIRRDSPLGMLLVVKQTDITAQCMLQAALAESEERFRATFEQAAIGMAHVSLDGRWLRVNDQLCAMLGYSRRELLATRFQDLTHPDDVAPDLAQMQRLLSGEVITYFIEKRYMRKDGGLLWVMLTVSVMQDLGGRPLQFIAAVDDITDRKLAEDALAESEDRLRLSQEAADIGTWEVLSPSGELRWSARNRVIFGFDANGPQPSITQALDRVHPEDRDRVAAELDAALATGDYRSEYRVLIPQPEGGTRLAWIGGLGRAFPARAPDNARLLGVNFDITERKRAEEHNALLMREVDHRAKNALAVVQAALRLTKADNQADFVRAVEGRVASLARAHTALAQRRWQGAELRQLLEGELMPFLSRDPGPGSPRTEISGPVVMLEAGPTQALCMALHELATNAVKYGALSQRGGVVTVTWRLADGRLRLTWRESGGPAAVAPTRRGFGSRVIEQTVQTQLGGRLERFWSATGLVVEITVPHGPAVGLPTALLPPQASVAAE